MSIDQEHIDSLVEREMYYVFPDTTVTVCCLVLRNGYAVTGTSACINPEEFDEEIGKDYARQDAENKIWQLEGYRLKGEI